MVPVMRQMRAYFAPVNRTTETPTLFDPAGSGLFALDSPPAPWIDLGWIEGFERSYSTPTHVVRSGANALPGAQFRGPVEARVEFDFREWGKLQMALAGGSEHMNVLATSPSAAPAPSGGTPIPGVAVEAGSTASEIIVGEGAVNNFEVGNLIAVDVDYQQQVGYVGSGISAAYVSNAALVNRDINYVRRVTFNVGRIVEVTATSVILAQRLLAGAPTGASAQVVAAFVDREGGSFFQEWSALFVAEAESGGRICFYYPRLSPNPGAGSGGMKLASGAGNRPPKGGGVAKTTAKGRTQSSGIRTSSSKFLREERVEIAQPLTSIGLHASFIALPFTDTNDGQTVVCYRSYFPAAMAAVY
jgi:hypothetical protein